MGQVVAVHDGLATVRVGKVDLVAVAVGVSVPQEVIVCIRGEEVLLERETAGVSSGCSQSAGGTDLGHDAGGAW